LPVVTDLAISFDSIYQLAASPLQELHSAFLEKAGISLLIKRDDLIHPQFGGNKWRKLKYNLIRARQQQYDTLLTFGGAWSNHIHATAAAGRHFGFNTIGMIRGEPHTPLNHTLSFAEHCGMQLHYLDRELYRQKNKADFLQRLQQRFGKIYILPEGGSNTLAVQGCSEVVAEIRQQLDNDYDVVCCACGTGATLAGIITGIEKDRTGPQKLAIGFSALKAGDFLAEEVNCFLDDGNMLTDWRVECRYHFGGYAKINQQLTDFMRQFHAQFDIALDAVYTAKMFYGLFDLIKSGAFSPGTVIIAVHSGGLQGNKGFNL
jgi:1-aminocyclopropane-1-carboxylate deaminase/D-cysteine desulfhydrase-like pyridoxal-dependent ACC family enzyme